MGTRDRASSRRRGSRGGGNGTSRGKLSRKDGREIPAGRASNVRVRVPRRGGADRAGSRRAPSRGRLERLGMRMPDALDA